VYGGGIVGGNCEVVEDIWVAGSLGMLGGVRDETVGMHWRLSGGDGSCS
jgi:hypothetical protein